jgi:hypothetical protein
MNKKKNPKVNKEGDDMSTITVDNISLKEFIKKNKKQIYDNGRKNAKLNAEGKPTISKNDPDFHDDEWEEHFKRMDKK